MGLVWWSMAWVWILLEHTTIFFHVWTKSQLINISKSISEWRPFSLQLLNFSRRYSQILCLGNLCQHPGREMANRTWESVQLSLCYASPTLCPLFQYGLILPLTVPGDLEFKTSPVQFHQKITPSSPVVMGVGSVAWLCKNGVGDLKFKLLLI